MVSRRLFLQSAAAAAIAAASAVPAARAADPGIVTDAEIKIGQTFPYSGPASGYGVIARPEAAYFKMINEKGGVNGRVLNLISLDALQRAQDRRADPAAHKNKMASRSPFKALAASPIWRSGLISTRTRCRSCSAPPVPTSLTIPRTIPGRSASTPPPAPRGASTPSTSSRRSQMRRSVSSIRTINWARPSWRGCAMGLALSTPERSSRKLLMRSRTPPVEFPGYHASGRGAHEIRYRLAALAKPAAQAIRKVYDLGWRTPERYLFFGASSIAGTLQPAGLEKCKGLITRRVPKGPDCPDLAGRSGLQRNGRLSRRNI